MSEIQDNHEANLYFCLIGEQLIISATLDEFLNFNKTAEVQAESAGRALGLLITKTIKKCRLAFLHLLDAI